MSIVEDSSIVVEFSGLERQEASGDGVEGVLIVESIVVVSRGRVGAIGNEWTGWRVGKPVSHRWVQASILKRRV